MNLALVAASGQMHRAALLMKLAGSQLKSRKKT